MVEETPRTFSPRRLAPLACLLGGGLLLLALGAHRYLNFAALAANHDWACALVDRAPVLAALAFVAAYSGLVALSVPGAALLTMASGFLFGTYLGTTYAVVSATLGATIVFGAARTGLAGLAGKVGPQMRRIEAGFRQNALSYLLVLRLVPVVPFWLVNLVAGASGMRLSSYLGATFVGMIPAAFVYASLGSGLGNLASEGRPPDLHILFRPGILLPILGLAALALVPVVYRHWRARHQP
ncbi:MAG TPA: VTT domain-containing protein [Stellaceae bacterium]|jgi:uncharacterized membrane protein YdjX (TVP38/TMEM64 family)